jgi:hypothetical protein
MWPEKVIARIEGGLGNQLFQYAAARSLADRLGCDLALDLRGLAENGNRPYQLKFYGIRAIEATLPELAALPHWRSKRRTRMHSRISQIFPDVFSFPVFWSSSFAFDHRIEMVSRPVYMVGYWQSEKYFFWNQERIKNDLQLLVSLDPQIPFLDLIINTNSVALHVRRGDYVTNPVARKFHGVCKLDYYHRAIDAIKGVLKDIHLFVFSDEPSWARENLQSKVPTYFVDSGSGDKGHIDLELMSRCRHNIIANSSFSWWGAWRAQLPEQRVIAPSRWFADPNTDTSDVIPSRWQVLD